MQAKVHFYLERRPLKNPKLPIYAYIRGVKSGKTLILNSGQRVEKKHWSKEKELVLDSHPDYKKINIELITLKAEIEKETTKFFLIHEDENITYEEYVDYIKSKIYKDRKKKKKRKPKNFFDALEEFLLLKKNNYARNTMRKYYTIRTILREFEEYRGKRKKIKFSEIDEIFMSEFADYLYDVRNAKNNYVSKTLQLVKSFLNYCYKRGYISNINFRNYSVSPEEIEVIALNLQELRAIKEVNLRDQPHLERVRDLFLFMCYTGQRFIDYVNLDYSDIKGDFWYLRQQKTKRYLEIPLIRPAKEILYKYAEMSKPLPLLSNPVFNRELKKVCKLAKIDEPVKITRVKRGEMITQICPKYELITAHTARRTFATNSLRLGNEAHVVMSITGHTQLRTFKKYINTATEDRKRLVARWEEETNKEI